MKKMLSLLFFTFASVLAGNAADLKAPAGVVQPPPAAVVPAGGTIQPAVIAPKDIVKKALDSLKDVISSKTGKDQQFNRMKNFSGCFLHPDIKQRAMTTLILGGMKGYTIVKESIVSTGAKVETDIQFDKEKSRVIFELVYRKNSWWITRIN